MVNCKCFATRLSFLFAIAALLSAQTNLKDYIPRVERNLKENIIPFWLTKSIDRSNGGYILNHDAKRTPEWHSAVSADLKSSGSKANIWKGGYHNGRAMLETLAILRTLK